MTQQDAGERGAILRHIAAESQQKAPRLTTSWGAFFAGKNNQKIVAFSIAFYVAFAII
jgi:hypothetical protein